jgi:hypothetical protein
MSALGQKRTSRVLEEKSALPPKADIRASAVGTGMVQHDDGTPTGGSPRELYCALSASRRLNIRKFASLTYRRPNDELPQREAARPRSILQSPPAPTMAGATMRGRCDMPHDPRELPAPPDLTADEVRDLGDRAAVELAEQKDRSHDEIRKTYALLKRVDEIMARR